MWVSQRKMQTGFGSAVRSAAVFCEDYIRTGWRLAQASVSHKPDPPCRLLRTDH